MLAAVAGDRQDKAQRGHPGRVCGQSVSNRSSERAGLVPGSDAQFSQKPCSPLIGEPQLGQSASRRFARVAFRRLPAAKQLPTVDKMVSGLAPCGRMPPLGQQSLTVDQFQGGSPALLLRLQRRFPAKDATPCWSSGRCRRELDSELLDHSPPELTSRVSVRRISPCEKFSWRSKSGSNHANRISLASSTDSAFARSRGGSSWRISRISGERTDTGSFRSKRSWEWGCPLQGVWLQG